jgi:hypothetical protein
MDVKHLLRIASSNKNDAFDQGFSARVSGYPLVSSKIHQGFGQFFDNHPHDVKMAHHYNERVYKNFLGKA